MFKKIFDIAALVLMITSCNNGGGSNSGGNPAPNKPPGELNADGLGYSLHPLA